MTRSLLTVLLSTLLLFSVAAPAISAEISSSPTATAIQQLVILPDGEYDHDEAEAMIERLAKIPLPLLEQLVDKEIFIKLVSGKITDEPELVKYRGVVPRGWEKTGLTWDDVPGVSVNVVIVRIGYSAPDKGHRSYNLEIHETMHAIDRFILGEISTSEKFLDIWKKEAHVKYKNDGYVSVYPAEYFAETATFYLYNEQSRADLKKNMPLTYQFLDELFTNLTSFMEEQEATDAFVS